MLNRYKYIVLSLGLIITVACSSATDGKTTEELAIAELEQQVMQLLEINGSHAAAVMSMSIAINDQEFRHEAELGNLWLQHNNMQNAYEIQLIELHDEVQWLNDALDIAEAVSNFEGRDFCAPSGVFIRGEPNADLFLGNVSESTYIVACWSDFRLMPINPENHIMGPQVQENN